VSERERRARPYQSISAEAVETLVWLLDAGSVDRRRYTMVNRLRALRESEQFESLPNDLRQRIRNILTDEDH